MAGNNVEILGPYDLNETDHTSAAIAALSGLAVASGLLTSWAQEGQVWFCVVEA